jgi:hypothetical protein
MRLTIETSMGEAGLLSDAGRNAPVMGNEAHKHSSSMTAIDSLQYRQAANEALNIP